MPLTKIDYSNTIIYKLCCKDLSITEVYIGHTTDFRKRKNCHKSDCNNEKHKNYNLKVYQFIRDNGNWDNWDMIEVERFEAIDGNNAKKRERYWIEELKANLNYVIPTRTKKEYRENNKETISEKKKKYNEKNKEKINEKAKEKVQCECGCEISRSSIAEHKKNKKHFYLMSMINGTRL